jgi:hypothetical protein
LKYSRSEDSNASRQLLGKYVRPSGRAAHGWERRNGLTTALPLESRLAESGDGAGGTGGFAGEDRFRSAESFGNADAIGDEGAVGGAETCGGADAFGGADVCGRAGAESGGDPGADFSDGADPSVGAAGGAVSAEENDGGESLSVSGAPTATSLRRSAASVPKRFHPNHAPAAMRAALAASQPSRRPVFRCSTVGMAAARARSSANAVTEV